MCSVVAAPARASVFAYVVGSTEDGISPYVKLLESADGGPPCCICSDQGPAHAGVASHEPSATSTGV